MPDPVSIDHILGTGLIQAEQVIKEIRDRLLKDVIPLYGNATIEQMITVAREVLVDFHPLLAAILSDVEIAAWVRAHEEFTSLLPGNLLQALIQENTPTWLPVPEQQVSTSVFVETPTIRFPQIESAAQSLVDSMVITRQTFDQLQEDQKRNAFTVAFIDNERVIAEIRDLIIDAVTEGYTKREFKNLLADNLETGHLASHHVANVYRTGVLSSYAAGKERIVSNPVISTAFPYAAYYAIHDTRTRPDHIEMESRGLNGTNVYRADDPMWRYRTPPWDYQCRCSKVYLTIRQAAQRGVEEARRWIRTGQPPLVPQYAEGDFFPPESGFVLRV